MKRSNGSRQSGPGVPPSPPVRFRWTIYLCCADLAVVVMMMVPTGADLPHLILRFLVAAAVALTAPALVMVAKRQPLQCVGCERQRAPAQMLTRHLCASCAAASPRPTDD